MYAIETEFLTKCSPEKAFAFVAEKVKNHQSDEDFYFLAVGSQFEDIVRKKGGEYQIYGEVVSYDQGKELQIRHESKDFRMMTIISFEDEGDETKIRFREDFELKKPTGFKRFLSRLFSPIIKMVMRHQHHKNFEKLMEIVEGGK